MGIPPMTIVLSFEHLMKQFMSNDVSAVESVILLSDLQLSKAEPCIEVTLSGIVIDFNEVHNIMHSLSMILSVVDNWTDSNESHLLSASTPIRVTPSGISIELRCDTLNKERLSNSSVAGSSK